MSKHLCHATDCQVGVSPRMLMCSHHWYMVPKDLQDAVWAAYVPGQEFRKDPTRRYLVAARDAINAVAVQEGKPMLPGLQVEPQEPILQRADVLENFE